MSQPPGTNAPAEPSVTACKPQEDVLEEKSARYDTTTIYAWTVLSLLPPCPFMFSSKLLFFRQVLSPNKLLEPGLATSIVTFVAMRSWVIFPRLPSFFLLSSCPADCGLWGICQRSSLLGTMLERKLSMILFPNAGGDNQPAPVQASVVFSRAMGKRTRAVKHFSHLHRFVVHSSKIFFSLLTTKPVLVPFYTSQQFHTGLLNCTKHLTDEKERNISTWFCLLRVFNSLWTHTHHSKVISFLTPIHFHVILLNKFFFQMSEILVLWNHCFPKNEW